MTKCTPDRPPGSSSIWLHGSAGVQSARELTYARQFAAMGVAALVVDTYGTRRQPDWGFVDRVVNITESMMIADAYAGLRFLAERFPQVADWPQRLARGDVLDEQGRPASADQPVGPGDLFWYWRDPPPEPPVPGALTILHHDEWLA